ncbi:uncharacterized protein VTP21DRAFT_7007 [Calcarisporiella thermophila]|uniref:uncharacterized protein n=1 Tax=Calcarisporiella thermophila TaxID=911321 RepID=UPI0037420628
MVLRSFSLLISLLVFFCIVGHVLASASHIVNDNLMRIIDLTTPIVREQVSVRFENKGASPISEYDFLVRREWCDKVADLVAEDKKTSVNLEVTKGSLMNQGQIYKIRLNNPIAQGEKTTITVKIAYVHGLEATPKAIRQMEKQILHYHGRKYFESPYEIRKQKTIVKTPVGMAVKHYSSGPAVEHKDSTITYGPFETAQIKNADEELDVLFEYRKAVLTVPTLQRDLKISHWGGNLGVEEHYALRVDGAKLSGQFSRLLFAGQQNLESYFSFVRQLAFNLPQHARDVFYRDEIGNVSTSHLRHEPRNKQALLQIQPRYPLFGGWNYTFYYGYNTPLADFARFHNPSGRYILNVPFVKSLPNVAHELVALNITLPEGARNIRVHLPFAVDKQLHTTRFTTLDTMGRTMVYLEKRNVVDEHARELQISYEYPTHLLLRKPLVASAAFAALFAISMLYSRMEFKIGK